MKMRRIMLVFVFLLLIPYICSLAIIGIGFNALVLHSTDPFRTAVGAFVGAIIMLVWSYDPFQAYSFLQQILRFFSIRRRPLLQVANFILDFVLCTLATIVIRLLLPLKWIVGTSMGFVILVMFISTCLGAYIEYDNLSIDAEIKQS